MSLAPPPKASASLRVIRTRGRGLPDRRHQSVIGHACLAVVALAGACTGADGEAPVWIDALPTTIDATSKEWFFREAAQAWRARREQLRGIEFDLTYVDRRPDDTESHPEEIRSTYCILADGVSRRLDRGKSIDVTNNRYSFKVRVSDPGTTYSLAEVDRWQRGAPQPLAGWLDIAELNIAMPSNIWWMPIEGIVANDDFRLTGVDRGVDDAGEETVRIVYRYTGEASESDLNLQPDGVYWAELLPSRLWSVLRSGLITSMTRYSLEKDPFEARVTTRYQDWRGVPLPEEIRIETVNLKTNAVVRLQEHRFGPPMACTRPSEEFFLPHYGLSEASIPPIESGPSDVRLWLVPVGMVLLMLAWMAHRRSRAG